MLPSNAAFKIWVHVILITKDYAPLIKPLIEPLLYQCLQESLQEQRCICKDLNGTEDHVHLLFLLNPQRTLAEVIKNLKSHSAYLVNQENLSNIKFAWANEHGAFSVGESFVAKMQDYMQEQKKNHQTETFQQEYDRILKWHSLNLSAEETT
jgi:putative transposase